MRFTVESWDPDYGAPSTAELEDASENVDVNIEVPAAEWAPVLPAAEPLSDMLFVDGVRRVDASLWIEQPPDFPGFALAATYAAGAVRCNGRAVIESADVGRGLFTSSGADDIDSLVGLYEVKATKGTTSEELWLGIQQARPRLSLSTAHSHIIVRSTMQLGTSRRKRSSISRLNSGRC
jgi:hypothetical protein